MSDFSSSLPTRTENNGDVVVQLVDGTVTSQKLTVNADGSVNVTDNGTSLTVDAVDLDIRDLAFATDKVDVTGSEVSLDATTLAALEDITVQNGAGAAAVNIQDGGNSITVDAADLDIRDLAFATDKVDVTGSEVSLDATTLAALEDITVQNGAGAAAVNIQDGGNSITVDATDLDIRDLTFASDKVDVTGSEVSLDATTLAALEDITVQNGAGAAAVNIQDGGNSITVDATDLDIRDLVAATDSVTAHIKDATGTAFSAANPLPVSMSASQPGDEINDYDTAAGIAGGASSSHIYTVTALKTMLLSQVEAAASGKMKIEVQIETGVATGVYVTKFVKFNSTAEPNMSIHLSQKIEVAAGVRIKIIRTNKDNQSQDLYSTICGSEI